MVCNLPLCKAIAQLNKDDEVGIEPGTKTYADSWYAYRAAGGSLTMINNLQCDCQHKHFVRKKEQQPAAEEQCEQ